MKPGEIVASKYRLTGRLGTGGMGEVWAAEHTSTEREFAIKFMHARLAASPGSRQRFTREARASARINHPNIIDVFDVGELEDGSLYLVMELLDGMSLDDALYAAPPLSVRDLLAVMVDTVKALAAAHAVDIVHRDVKPGNIFLHRERSSGLATAKVLDFGISKFSAANDGSNATKNSSILGSPRYMSPEQTRSAANVDARADIWSVGVVLFQGLTGRWPHEGDSFSSLVVAIATLPPKPIDAYARRLPPELCSLVQRCLGPLEQRIQTAAELAAGLERILGNGDLANIPLPPQRDMDEVSHHGVTTGGLRVKTPPPLTGSGAGISVIPPFDGGGAQALAALTPSKAVPADSARDERSAVAIAFSGILDDTTTQSPPSSDASNAATDPLPKTLPPPPSVAPVNVTPPPLAFPGGLFAPPVPGSPAVALRGGGLTASVSTMNVETLAVPPPNDLTTSRPSHPVPPFQPPISQVPPFRSRQTNVLRVVAIMLGVAAVGIGALVFSAARAPSDAQAGSAAATSQSELQPAPTAAPAVPDPIVAVSSTTPAAASASVAPSTAALVPGKTQTKLPVRQPKQPQPPPPKPAGKKKTIEGLGSGL
jgi:serine/threonine-protein kinase